MQNNKDHTNAITLKSHFICNYLNVSKSMFKFSRCSGGGQLLRRMQNTYGHALTHMRTLSHGCSG